MKILDIVNRWPGSVHDSRIFNCSRLNLDLLDSQPDGYMLGDAGYPCLPYLLTQQLHSAARTFSPAEKAYQKSHVSTRNLVERTFGAWKARFQCLKGLRLKLSTSMNVISACAVIWNFLRMEGDPLSLNEETAMEQQEEPGTEASQTRSSLDSAGRTKRELLINSYFRHVAENTFNV